MATTEPSRTITVLCSDVEGSTRLWETEREAMSVSLEVHDRIVCQTTDSWGGHVVATVGDTFTIVFDRATRGVKAATRIQARLAGVDWGDGPALRVRIGLHSGEVEGRDGDDFRLVTDTAARVEAVGHGGQVLASEATVSAAGLRAKELGEHRLADAVEPVRLFQVGEGTFPPLRTEPTAPRALRAHPTA